MKEFKKYIHLERYGTDEVDGINIGQCYIFPKLDGTNGSAWLGDDGSICAGSRNRKLSLDDDNHGFMAWITQQENWNSCLEENSDLTFYGEWLVPHSLKTYRDEAWRRFYVFDVACADGSFMTYEQYKPICEKHGIDYIPCVLKSRNPDYDILHTEATTNKFMLKEGELCGEGIVIKNYAFQNRFGRQTWAKLITATFKDKHVIEMGGKSIDCKMVEESIAEEFMTLHIVEKIIAKIRSEDESFTARHIPRLLSTAFHDLVTEELWEAIKKHKNPRIDFKALNRFTILRVKQLKPELFGV